MVCQPAWRCHGQDGEGGHQRGVVARICKRAEPDSDIEALGDKIGMQRGRDMPHAKVRVQLAKFSQQRHHHLRAIFGRGGDPQFSRQPGVVGANVILQSLCIP